MYLFMWDTGYFIKQICNLTISNVRESKNNSIKFIKINSKEYLIH